MCSDVVGKSECFADAIEESGTHVTAGFVDDGENGCVRMKEAVGPEADDDDGLLLVESVFPLS